MEISVHVQPSLQKLGKAFGEMNVESFLREEILKIAYRVERFAKQLAPVDTGRMRSTIGVSQAIRGLGAIVATNVGYAIYVHEGTRYMRARPFMERGADMAQKYIEGDIKSKLDSEFVKAFKAL